MPPVCTGEHPPKGTIVSIIVIEFITLDGIVTDPDGPEAPRPALP
jgi:hypothetical protein